MAIGRKDLIIYVERTIVVPLRITYRSASGHPLVFSLVIFLLIVYSYFPSLFTFLLSTSPILACTTVLLGLLLSYGEPNIPEIEDDNSMTRHVSSLAVQATADDLCIQKDENFVIENNAEVGEATSRGALLGKENSKFSLQDDEDYILEIGTKGDAEAETVVKSLSDKDEKDVLNKEKVDQEERSKILEDSRNSEIYNDKLNDTFLVAENTSVFGSGEKKESGTIMFGHRETEQLDAFQGSSWKDGDYDAFSDSESGRAESSSPDASMADIIPMLDELHPLLELENSQHLLVSKNDSDADSEDSSVDHEFSNNSDIDEAEQNDDEGSEEVQEGKKNDTEVTVKWTEDDQKNVMVLGASELERNRRLEILIAKRRARKNLTNWMEGNLIDLDINLHVPPPISAPRRNPFDPPSVSEEKDDLPPLPGSAPSSLLLRRNPFEFLYDQEDETSNFMDETSGYSQVPQRDVFFRRNETAIFSRRELVQERRHSRLKPYFVAERMDSEEGSSSGFQRQLYERSDSKVSSVAESDLISSLADTEDHKELSDEELHQELELSSFNKHDVTFLDHGSQHSEGAEPVDLEIEKVEHEITIPELTLGAEASEAAEDDLREEISFGSNISTAVKLETIAEKYDEIIFSSSSETDEKSFTTTFRNKLPAVPEQTQNVAGSLYAESNHVMMGDKVDNQQSKEIFYDFSLPPTRDSMPDQAFTSAGLHEDYPLGSNVLMGISVDLSRTPFQFSSISAAAESFELHQFADNGVNKELVPDEEKCFEIHEPADLAGLHLTGKFKSGSDADTDCQKPENSISSFVFPPIPLHDNDDAGLAYTKNIESVTGIGSTGYSSLSDLKSELRFMSSTDLSGALSGNQETHLIDLDSSEDELDVVRLKVSRAGDIDEAILSELDVVGDFHTDDSVTGREGAGLLEQQESEDIDTLSLSSYVHDSPLHMQFSEDRSTLYPESPIALISKPSLDESEEIHSVQQQPQSFESEADFSFGSFHGPHEQVQEVIESVPKQPLEEAMDSSAVKSNIGKSITANSDDELRKEDSGNGMMEKIIHDSELPVIEAKSTEDILPAFRQASREPMDSSVSGDKLGKLMTEKFDLEAIVAVITERNEENKELDSEIVVLEAKSTEDIISAFKQIKEEAISSSVSKSSTNPETIENSDNEAREANALNRNMQKSIPESESELLVLEARSAEDISSAFEQIKEEGLKTSASLEDQSTQDIHGKEHPKPQEMQSEVLNEAKSFNEIQVAMKQLTDGANEHASNSTGNIDRPLEVMADGRNLELQVAFKKVVAKETKLGEEIGVETGVEEVHDVVVSGPSSSSSNAQKKPKSHKSGSSSSSSSSSSDSDSE